jgi:hypothetical protein
VSARGCRGIVEHAPSWDETLRNPSRSDERGPAQLLPRKVQNDDDGSSQERGRGMSTATIIVVAVWNTLLLCALLAGVVRWRRVLRWIIGLDRDVRSRWDLGNADVWGAFLADHPDPSRDDLWPKS